MAENHSKTLPADWKEILESPDRKHLFDFLKHILDDARYKARMIPPPLPWVEPSINMPHLQACVAYIFGSPLGAMMTMGALLEHALRLAVIDTLKGFQGAMEQNLWQKYAHFSVAGFLNGGDKKKPDSNLISAVNKIIPPEDSDWWRDVVERIRNKVTYLDYPMMNTGVGQDEAYMGLYTIPDRGWAFKSRHEWGFVFHRFDESVAAKFLNDATEKLKRVIENMKWQPNITGWISQKWEYDSFFAFEWARAGLQSK